MAGDWIKMRTDLRTHPKVVRISSALQADTLRTIGALHSMWSLFDAHADDGKLEGYTTDIIDQLIGWNGFADAVESVGWLEVTEDSVVAPDFGTHNSKSAKKRAQDSVRKMSARQADKKRTREEKRREEKSKNTTCSLGASGKVSFDYKAGEWRNITDEHRAKWSATCPNVNVDTELASMARWLTLRGNRYQDYAKFIANWLLRAAKDTAGNGPRKTGAELLDEYEAKHGQKRSQPD